MTGTPVTVTSIIESYNEVLENHGMWSKKSPAAPTISVGRQGSVRNVSTRQKRGLSDKKNPHSKHKGTQVNCTIAKFSLHTPLEKIKQGQQQLATYFEQARGKEMGRSIMENLCGVDIKVATVPNCFKIPAAVTRIMQKQPISQKTVLGRRPTNKITVAARNGTYIKNQTGHYGIRLERDQKLLQLLRLENVLTWDAAMGQYAIALLHLTDWNGGWIKSCKASGNLTYSRIEHFMNRPLTLASSGLTKEKIDEVQITSKGGSGKFLYTNAAKEDKKFQCGGYLNRATTKPKKNKTACDQHCTRAIACGYPAHVPFIKLYHEEMRQIFDRYAHLLMDEAKTNSAAEHVAGASFSVATNLIEPSESKMHVHLDKKSQFPAIISGCNPAGAGRQYSGGELCFVEGGILLQYGERDVVLMNGSRPHGVTAIAPSDGQQKCTRFSAVHFSNNVVPGGVYLGCT